jgi:type IV pilus assembly protein PilB
MTVENHQREADAPVDSTTLVVDLLEAAGLIPENKVAEIRARSLLVSVPEALIEQEVASTEAISRILAAKHRAPVVELGRAGIDPEASMQVPLHVLERVVAIPFAVENGRLCVAFADPGDLQGIDEVRLAARYPIDVQVAARDEIQSELRRLTRAAETFGARSGGDEIELEVVEEVDDLEADDGISDAPLVRLVNSIIFEAAEEGASDVHFEPHQNALVVRYRVDGVLHEVQRLPKKMSPGVTTRLKVLAKLDIAERRKPQDGRMTLDATSAGRLLDVRVATLPTVEGEAVVMRLLDKSKKPPTLEEVGLDEEMSARLTELIRRPTGAVLVTGPTGSGKSTTLFALLNEINRPELKIITVEDPVEYRLAGANQVQINTRAGVHFATALRSILRADPDVVMVGEIRDAETAKISIESALTGHFVLSTLHTNDAPSALTRLNEMGVEPFLTGAAVTAVLAQRLARRLCETCREAYTPTPEELVQARLDPDETPDDFVFYRKQGCVACRQTGYRGRIGIFQLLTMSEELQHLASSKATRTELEQAAIAEGMQTLWSDGLSKVAAGVTSIEEVARVVG